MSFQEVSRKAVAAGAIVAAHALVLYVVIVAAPTIKSMVVSAPLAVSFVSQPQSQPSRTWEPPVEIEPQQVQTEVPQMPMIETAVAPAVSRKAITAVALRAPAPPAPSTQHDSEPRLISEVEYVREPVPRYPPQSRRAREQGLVVLRVLIDEQGKACDIEVESSSGYARLDRAAREAVLRAAFRPYIEDGEPRRALVLIPIEFALSRSAA